MAASVAWLGPGLGTMAGDASSPMHVLSFAIADGARAGIGAHASLVMAAMPKH